MRRFPNHGPALAIRRILNVPFAARVLLLGRNQGLPIVISPSSPACAPGGSISFSASPGAGLGGVIISPEAPTCPPGGSVGLQAEVA